MAMGECLAYSSYMFAYCAILCLRGNDHDLVLAIFQLDGLSELSHMAVCHRS